MKILIRNANHAASRSYETMLVEINGKKVKLTYEAFNGGEKAHAQLFNGIEWAHLFNMDDLGMEQNRRNTYLLEPNERKRIADTAFKGLEKLCLIIL